VGLSGAYGHDPRHRFSYELRPDAELDATLRAIASELEARGLILPGASTAPRFHPHLTLARASRASTPALENAGRRVEPDVTFGSAGTFGDGRIIYLEPDRAPAFQNVRAGLVATLAPDELDPLVKDRPWTPHVTVAYAVPKETRTEALEHVRAQLPVRGTWASIETWDLDVRPTRLMHEVRVAPPA
jgi:2'-5' RNA ligase